MPIFKLQCEDCGREEKKLMSKRDSIMCQCGGWLEPQLPTTMTSTTMETRDAYRGVQVKKGLDQQLKKRYNDHHDRHELERKIDQHGLEDAVRSGWTKKVKKV